MATVGAVSSNLSATAVTAAYQSQTNDLVLANAVGGAFTVTLPIAPATSNRVVIKKTDSSANLVTIALPASSTATIDGDTTIGLYTQGSAATLQYDGTNWRLTSTAMVAVPSQSATLGSAYQPWTAGRTFFAVPQPQQGFATSSLTTGSIYLWSVRVPNACKITSIGTPVGAAVTASWNIGLYADNAAATSKGPATLLWSGTGSTTTATTVQTTVNYTLGTSALVWIAWQPSAAVSLWYNQRTQNNLWFGDVTSANPVCAYSAAVAYASGLPADMSATATTGFSFPTPPFTVTCG